MSQNSFNDSAVFKKLFIAFLSNNASGFKTSAFNIMCLDDAFDYRHDLIKYF